jgi:hypothetical protein
MGQDRTMGGIGSVGSAGQRTAQPARARRTEAEAPVATGRSIIAVAPADAVERPIVAHRRTLAPLVAHLIATVTDAPQLRLKRRADPADAMAAYQSANRLGPTRLPVFERAI